MERLAAVVLLSSVVAGVVTAPPELPPFESPLKPKIQVVSMAHPDDAMFEMDARLLASVARAEDPNAPTAVMWVVINRANKYHNGNLWHAVTSGEAFGTRKNGRWEPIKLTWPRNARMDQLESRATMILLGKVKDPTGGATHFHRVGTWEPPWAPPLPRRSTFGSHYFYRAMSWKEQQSRNLSE